MAASVERVELLSPVKQVTKPTRKGTTIGHEFTVSIRLTDIRNCLLEWWEKTDAPYSDGMTANRWCDMYRLNTKSDVFSQWNFHRDTVPLGACEFVLNDPPGIMVNETTARTLFFEIRVKENNLYGDEPNQQRIIRAKQILRTNPISHQFVVLANDLAGEAAEGHPKW